MSPISQSISIFVLIFACWIVNKQKKYRQNDSDSSNNGENKSKNGNKNTANNKFNGNDTETEHLAINPLPRAQKIIDAEDARRVEYRTTFKHDISQIFWLFAGHSPYGKNQLYMKKNELQEFLNVVSIYDPIDKIFSSMDSEIEDNRISQSEFVSYFTDINTNPQCIQAMESIIKQDNWPLIRKSIKIFEIIDQDHSGEINQKEFIRFCQLIEVFDEIEMIQLWNEIDLDASNSISLKELLTWFTLRLYHEKRMKQRESHLLKQKNQQLSSSDVSTINSPQV